jgi:hypothetical protein
MSASISPVVGSDHPRRQLTIPPGRYTRILQVIGNLSMAVGSTSTEVRTAAQLQVLSWLKGKKGIPVSDSAMGGLSWDFESPDSARTVEIETSPGLWAMRFDDPCNELIGRIWRVELAIADTQDAGPALGCTLSVLVPAGAPATIPPSVPVVVRDIARTIGLKDDGRELNGSPWQVERPADVERLITLIENPARNRAVVVVTHSPGKQSFADAARIGQDLAGIAHVVELDPSSTYELSRRFGKPLSVFGDAVRVYRTGFDSDNDNRFRHPLFLADKWGDRLSALRWALRFDAIQETIARPDEARDLPSFSLIRRVAVEQRLREALKAPNALARSESMERDFSRLQDDMKQWEEMAIEEERSRRAAERARDEAKQRAWSYAARLRMLEQALSDAGKDTAPTEWPDSFDDLSEWAETNLAGRVVVTPRAIKVARQSVFRDHELAYRALHHLGTTYWEMRAHGGAALLEACKTAEAGLGLTRSNTGAAIDDSRFEDQYRVTYEGTTYVLDQHLVGSASHNEQHCLRIYFAWDSEESLVIVGSLPIHLTNSLT